MHGWTLWVCQPDQIVQAHWDTDLSVSEARTRGEDHFFFVIKEGLIEFGFLTGTVVNLDILGLRRRSDITTLLPYGRAV